MATSFRGVLCALVLVFGSAHCVRGQILPNPDALVPFAPIAYNGPVSGNGGTFIFMSFEPTVPYAITLWVFNGNTGQQIPYPGALPAAVPFSIGPGNLNGFDRLFLHNGLGPGGVDPAEDDNPQGLAGSVLGPGGRTMHHRRHHLTPVNQNIVDWYTVESPGETTRLMLSTVIKVDVMANVMDGGVVTIDYQGYPSTNLPPFATSVWPSLNSVNTVNLSGPPNTAVQVASASVQPQPQVLSDLAPNVYSTFNTTAPNALAWVTGSQLRGDTPPAPPAPQPPGILVLADYSVSGATPQTTSVELGSPYSPYADKILVWNDVSGATALAQYVLVPCRDGVEIYDPAPAGPPGTPPALLKTIPVAVEKEICSNVSYFGPSPVDDFVTPYFIVLERDRGELQFEGVNFIVFDLLPASTPARGPTVAMPTTTFPGLASNYGRESLDMVRGFNDIAVAPPRRDSTGGWDPFASPTATAWFGIWDATASLAATPPGIPAPPWGVMVGVENWGLSTYTDGGLGVNAAGPFAGENVRYFTPARNTAGETFDFPVPVGEVSTNPIFNPLPAGGLVNQNLVAWYWDNGYPSFEGPGPGSGYGVALLDVLNTWVTTNPAFPGGIPIDGTAAGTYPTTPDRSHETITERPLFGYVNYPTYTVVFAQRQSGIETFGATLVPGSPRGIYGLARFNQTPPPTTPSWQYQKRRHTAWNPPPSIHAQVNAAGNPYTWGIDTAITVEATQAWTEMAPQPGADDWVSYFINWRFDVLLGLSPWAQGAGAPPGYLDWHSARAVATGNNPLGLGATDATSAPPPNQRDIFAGPIVGFPYYSAAGQTPLWADWNGVGGLYFPPYRTVLRSHSNPFPINVGTNNDAWVGVGANQMVQYSFGSNDIASAEFYNGPVGNPINPAFGEPSIIACHIDQVDNGASLAGLSPRLGGPGQFRANFLHFQADPSLTTVPTGPGYPATCVNDPAGAVGNWQFLLPVDHVVTTEILPYTPR